MFKYLTQKLRFLQKLKKLCENFNNFFSAEPKFYDFLYENVILIFKYVKIRKF